MTEIKKELLQDAIAAGNEHGFISWDGILDLCDEESKLVSWLSGKLKKMEVNKQIEFELDY